MTDPAEFEAFMRNYQNMVFTTALRLTANHAEAQDIAQNVFLKAYERFDALHESPSAGGWLKTVATNLSLNHLSRYRKRWKTFSDLQPATEESAPEDFAASQAAPPAREAADAVRSETRKVLEDALAHLPTDQRTALVLYHFEDMPYQEIADRMKVSLAKVKIDIMRGRETLRAKLASLRPELELNG